MSLLHMHIDWVDEQEDLPLNGDTEQATEQATEQVEKLLRALGEEELSAAELMKKLGLRHRPTFLYSYLKPAIEAGFVEPTIPDKPNSPQQRYRKACR